jgi:uncharacterized protein (DUF1501 family)
MLTVGQAKVRNCQGVTRRELLQVGAVSTLGLTLADWHANVAAASTKKNKYAQRDAACIFLWLDGGPSHYETFDPKPDATDAIRGPFGAIPTSTSGVFFSELLPMTANWMDRVAIIRSLNHSDGSHSAIPMLSGLPGENTAIGAVVSKLKGFSGNMPPFVHFGSNLSVGGGKLGPGYDPVKIEDPTGKKIELPGFTLNAALSPERLGDRQSLLSSIDRTRASFDKTASVVKMDEFHKRAYDILTSTKVREAFDMSRETEATRDRYGANFFGQSCLMARRLVEAGTRFVQIKWYDGPAWDAWDVHGADLGGMVRMERHLCPRFDQGLTALLEDLTQRGMLDSTLVVAVGEFGRTPQINKYGARDHWPYCFSALLAGGGVPGGTVIGASDKEGGRPADHPVSPAEFAATLYHLIGINTTTVDADPRVRPFIRGAAPVSELL